jgi:OmcA/MtrC family decaheme c-type cytochrome
MLSSRYSSIIRSGLLALFVAALAGCGGGSDGKDGATGPQGPQGPAGAPGVDATGVIHSDQLTAEDAAAVVPKGQITSVVINSPPVVKFNVTDTYGNPMVGLTTSQLRFTIAKLVPGVKTEIFTSGVLTGTTYTPNKWVNYIVSGVPDASTGVATPSRPSTENVSGNLVDNGGGNYTYTFARNIAGKSTDAQATDKTKTPIQKALADYFGANASNGGYVKAEVLGTDGKALDYDPTLTHRVAIQFSGSLNGNPLLNPINITYDFVPNGGAVTEKRDVVDVTNCNTCHGKVGTTTPHGGRVDTKYCVMCHTDQRKMGRTDSTAGVSGYTGAVYRVDGKSWGDFPTMIHKIHMGEELTVGGSNFANVQFNEVKFPQDQRNCTKCHSGSNAPQANNFKSVPSTAACGACHDNVNFATGLNHEGGIKADTDCAGCHKPADIALYHIPVTPMDPNNCLTMANAAGCSNNTNAAAMASNQDNLPTGAIKVTYDVSSVSLWTDPAGSATNATGAAITRPQMVFKMLQNGVAVPFQANSNAEIWANFIGSPSLYFWFSVPQDNIAAPSDLNASASVYLKTLWKSGTGGTLTGPDANGYYTAKLTTVVVPSTAKMFTGGMGYSYSLASTQPLTQTNLAKYPYNAGNKTGGLIVIAPNVYKPAAANTSTVFTNARRAIVDNAKCNACHQRLGAFTSHGFHAGQRNDGPTCAVCHNPNRTSSGWSADSTTFIHGIHGASKRQVEFNWHSVSEDENFSDVGFPGILQNCTTCHVSNAVNFGIAANLAVMPNKLFRTVATGTPAPVVGEEYVSNSPYITAATNYGSGFSYTASTGAIVEAADTTLVSSPTAAACFSCHDTDIARSHMVANGGVIYATRASVKATGLAITGVSKMFNNEQCILCHGKGKVADTELIHQ